MQRNAGWTTPYCPPVEREDHVPCQQSSKNIGLHTSDFHQFHQRVDATTLDFWHHSNWKRNLWAVDQVFDSAIPKIIGTQTTAFSGFI